jgi:ribonucleoside-diphosphate reductase alpha chain
MGRYPTPQIEENSHYFRPLGLGYANLGALLMAQGVPYDSDEGRNIAADITRRMNDAAWNASEEIAAAMGPFPGFVANGAEMNDVLKTKGRIFRNAQVTVLAPTGTIGFMMDCDTTGVEPDVALVKYKKLAGGGTIKIINSTIAESLRMLGYDLEDIKEILSYVAKNDTIEGAPYLTENDSQVFDCAYKPAKGKRSISWEGHVKMMSAVQPFISGAISKTVALSNNATVDDIEKVYMTSWKLGLKAIAVYRDGCKRQQPINMSRAAPIADGPKDPRRRLPDTRQSITHKFSVGGQEGYITVGMYDDGTPGELFCVMAKEGSVVSGLMDCFATSVSIALQFGVPLQILVNKFAHTRFEPSGFTSNKEIPIAKSLVDYIFRWLELRFLTSEKEASQSDSPPCPNCGAITIRSGSCYKCAECGSTTGCS